MKGVCRLGWVMLSGAVFVGLTGCADNESMLFIRGVMVPTDSASCVLTPSADAVLMTGGVWDTAFGNAYYADLLVGNQLGSQGDKTRLRTETSSVTLEGAEVTIKSPDGDTIRSKFFSPGAGFIEVGSGEETGYGGVSVVVIPSSSSEEALNVTSKYVIAEMKVFGKTLGGQEVESGIFKFPIDVCAGCLVWFPSSAMSADGVCVGSDDSTASLPCRLGQDDAVSCEVCANSYSVCEAP